MEISVNSIEEMCDLMCDNKLPRRYASYKGKGNKSQMLKDLQSQVEELKGRNELLEMKVRAMENNLYFKLNEFNKKQVDDKIFQLVLEQYN